MAGSPAAPSTTATVAALLLRRQYDHRPGLRFEDRTHKVLKRRLTAERWNCADPVWVRGTGLGYRRLHPHEARDLDADVGESGQNSLHCDVF